MKKTQKARGYGYDHKKARKRWERLVAAGGVYCSRCARPILADQRWHLDHTDDRMEYLGASHVRCNVAAANRGRRRVERAPRPGWRRPDGQPASRQWDDDFYWVGPGDPPPGTSLDDR